VRLPRSPDAASAAPLFRALGSKGGQSLGHSEDNNAKATVEAVIRDYIESWYEGDPVRMERALYSELVKRTPAQGDSPGPPELREVTKERMVELTRGGGAKTPGADYEIEVHHVYGRIASGLVRSVEYLDYVQLVETADGWKIANILFRTHAA